MRKLVLAAALLTLTADSASAGTVRVDFTGHVDYGVDPVQEAEIIAQQESSLGWSIANGTPFAGFFTFDDSVAPADVRPDEDVYLFLSPDWTRQATLGSLAISPGPILFDQFHVNGNGYSISVSAPPGYESVVDVSGQVEGISSVGGNTSDALYFTVELRRALSDPLGSTDLAATPFELSAYELGRAVWEFNWDGGGLLEIAGPLDSLTDPRPVPETSTTSLAALALSALALQGFRRARS